MAAVCEIDNLLIWKYGNRRFVNCFLCWAGMPLRIARNFHSFHTWKWQLLVFSSLDRVVSNSCKKRIWGTGVVLRLQVVHLVFYTYFNFLIILQILAILLCFKQSRLHFYLKKLHKHTIIPHTKLASKVL